MLPDIITHLADLVIDAAAAVLFQCEGNVMLHITQKILKGHAELHLRAAIVLLCPSVSPTDLCHRPVHLIKAVSRLKIHDRVLADKRPCLLLRKPVRRLSFPFHQKLVEGMKLLL